ncbi:MAG: formylglycine-generating enzyme family protein [Nitrospinaceae bacterium]
MKVWLTTLILVVGLLPSGTFAKSENENSIKDGMVLIPGGVYEMGNRRSLMELNPGDVLNADRHALGPENPAHKVYVDAFYIDIHETTNAEYLAYVKATGAREPAFTQNPDFNGPRQPVVGVSWKEAEKYCQWSGKRLPTEAEWEKASRGQRIIEYPWGNDAPDSTRLNFNEEIKKTVPVKSYEAGKSDYGVYDLAGNVSEWVYDWHFPEYYIISPKKNPRGPERGKYKVIRGGNWRNHAEDVAMTYRNATVPSLRSKTVGFRCARNTPGDGIKNN